MSIYMQRVNDPTEMHRRPQVDDGACFPRLKNAPTETRAAYVTSDTCRAGISMSGAETLCGVQYRHIEGGLETWSKSTHG